MRLWSQHFLATCAAIMDITPIPSHPDFWPGSRQKSTELPHRSVTKDHLSQSTKPPIFSGHEPQIIARFGSLPLRGAKIFIFFLFSSTSATYTKPRMLASRMFSGVSFGSACAMAKRAFCIWGEGWTLSKRGGTERVSASPPGRREVSIAEALWLWLDVWLLISGFWGCVDSLSAIL